MEIGLVGVGRMGAGILRRWQDAGHTVIAHDVSDEARGVVEEAGGEFVSSLDVLIQKLPSPRTIWLMIPSGDPVREAIDSLGKKVETEDIILDGGNSNYKDSVKHGEKLAKRGVQFVDVGVSGGVAGEQTGYALMAGGDSAIVEKLKPLFDALAAPDAFAHVGPIGAGHFVKMVHNAVEYGMMQAIGEGFDLLKNGPYDDLELAEIANMWSHGTIIRSFLMELATKALKEDDSLAGIAGYVDDSGEGRWSVEAAVDHAVPFWVNTAALYARFDSRQPDSFSAKLIAALRKEFGGHEVREKK